jgi:hypothetical protein
MQVLNTHHVGGVDHLPPNSVYVGRPSPYGNEYSSKSGKYSKEESVAMHRISLYKRLIEDKSYFDTLKNGLLGKDLACWCKHPKRFFPCHADNYVHLFLPEFINRTYDKSVLYYLVEDLKHTLKILSTKLMVEVSDDYWVRLYASSQDIKIDLGEVLREYKEEKIEAYPLCIMLAFILVDLEACENETDPDILDYRLLHVEWNVYRNTTETDDRANEPIHPAVTIKKPKKLPKVSDES